MDNRTALEKLLQNYRDNSTSKRHQGDTFERLTKLFLENDNTYKRKYKKVYMWADWAELNAQKTQDTGIDLVAETFDNKVCAIQCKFFAPESSINKHDIDSFMTLSSKRIFHQRLFVDTTQKTWGKNAEDAIKDQTPVVEKLTINDFAESNIDWSQYSFNSEIKFIKKTPRPHQQEVLKKTKAYFKNNNRGKLIMACGTGKTFTSLKIAEQQAGKGKTVLYLVPSLALMSQTIREWFNDSDFKINAISVCSDQKVSKAHFSDDLLDISISNIPIPVTTVAADLSCWVNDIKTDCMNVVFSTYQSIQVISDTQNKYAMGSFDIVICDEAHRTTGVTLADNSESNFVKVHDNDYIAASKRLYMTATPKIYSNNVKIKAKQADAVLAHMGDTKLYGEDIHHVSFNYAVEHDLLTDYKVIVLSLNEDAVDAEFQALLTDDDEQLDIEYTTKLIGCYKALCKTDLQEDKITDKNPMRRGVAFAKDIKLSKNISKIFPKIAQAYQNRIQDRAEAPLNIEMQHIDGSFDADYRKKSLNWLQDETDKNICRILSNARCLAEGVDVPTLDAVLFLHPRKSQVDVIQAVGRVMRRTKDKKMGYIILPVAVPAGEDPNKSLDKNERYKVVWQVLNALRSHDERLSGNINRVELGGDISDKIEIICQSNIFPSDKPNKPTNNKPVPDELDGTAPDNETHPEQQSFNWEDSILRAIKSQLVEKCGTRDYWEDWATDIAQIAKTHIERIKTILATSNNAKAMFDDFLKELKDDLNPAISEDDAIELLAQHLITKPVFNTLFTGYEFTEKNPVSIAINQVLSVIQNTSIEAETEKLQGFYNSVKRRVADTKTVSERQQLIVILYDKFFKKAFPKTAAQLGIVYTPVEIVDFIIHSINDILVDEFGTEIGAEGVNIIDPFTGTGTFITRLLQSGLIKPEQLPYKYKNEIHCNEIVLLAYYIAAINIEQVYAEIMQNNYSPFEGICLTDTFQMYESEDMIQKLMPDNSERRKNQKQLDIRVIMGNPPYSAKQKSANDNAQNIKYPTLDQNIEQSYVAHTTATNKNSLYDSYIRALRWGSDRLGDCGVMGYISGSGYIEKSVMDGMRKCLVDEYTNLYVFNLRGDIRKNMLSKGRAKEGQNVFGSGSMTGIAITLFVKNLNATSHGNIYYHDIGNELTTKQKLTIIQNFKSINGIKTQQQANTIGGQIGFEKIIPDKYQDWLNQRDETFYDHIAIGDKQTKGKADTQAIFANYSNGLKTNRDAWVYNSSKTKLHTNVKTTIDFYNSECDRYQNSDKSKNVKDFVNYDSTKISWGRQNLQDLKNNKEYIFNKKSVAESLYRPFIKQWVYFNKDLNDMIYQLPKIFPMGSDLPNRCICVTGVGNRSGFSIHIVDTIPDLSLVESCQIFPLKLYQQNTDDDLLNKAAGDYLVRDGITDYAQHHFAYDGAPPDKEAIFYYIYGILHHPDYTAKWEKTLAVSLPHIPKVKTHAAFVAFAEAGRKLADLHINYESIEPYKVNYLDSKGIKSAILDPLGTLSDKHYRVEKMKFAKKGKEKDKTTIIYNDHITLTDIPLAAYQYVVNAKSAIEWVMDRQSIRTDKASGIINDANDYAIETMNNPKYPLELLQKVITVSLETRKLINKLPALEF